MKKLTVITLICIAGVSGCTQEQDSVSQVENNETNIVQVTPGADSRVREDSEAPKLGTVTNKSLVLHPLRDYFIPEGYRVLDYFGRQYAYCKPENLRHEQCDASAADAEEKARAAGIAAKAEDFKNPEYLKMHLAVLEGKKESMAAIREKYPSPKYISEAAAARADFEKRAEELLVQLIGDSAKE